MSLNQLAKDLVCVCEQQGLDYDPSVLPIKLTADCYIIYATPMTEGCQSHGNCQVKQYYALTGGDTITVCESTS